MYKEMFTQGMSLRQIEKETGIPRKKLSRLLKEEGIEIKARSTGTTGQRKYSLREDAFSVIHTREQAYWLGFLYADGYVDSNKLELCLGEKDKEHLERFQDFLNTDAPIKERMIGHSIAYRINVCSTKLASDLAHHGCVQGKSLILDWPDINPGLTSHFMRGYFDGDGCCYRREDGQLVWSLVGTEQFLRRYQSILMHAGLNETKMRHGHCGQAWEIRYSGNNTVGKIMEYLYRNSNIHLERKCYSLPSRDEATEDSGL